MRLLYLIVIFLVWVEPILAQAKTVNLDSIAQKIVTIKVEPKFISTDKLGNIYIVSNTNQLYKYSIEGELLSTLNYNYVGNITSVDVSNPLEVYVFYKELNTVIFLDNNLAYRGKTVFKNDAVTMASAAARSYANGIWVFDAADMQLKKLNHEGNVGQTSGNIRQFVNKSFNAQFIADDGMQVYVADSANGILVFDVFANYKKAIPIKGSTLVKVGSNQLATYSKTQLQIFKTKPFVNFVNINYSDGILATLAANNIVIGTKTEVNIYKIVAEMED